MRKYRALNICVTPGTQTRMIIMIFALLQDRIRTDTNSWISPHRQSHSSHKHVWWSRPNAAHQTRLRTITMLDAVWSDVCLMNFKFYQTRSNSTRQGGQTIKCLVTKHVWSCLVTKHFAFARGFSWKESFQWPHILQFTRKYFDLFLFVLFSFSLIFLFSACHDWTFPLTEDQNNSENRRKIASETFKIKHAENDRDLF